MTCHPVLVPVGLFYECPVVLGQLIGRPRRELTLTGELNLTFTDPGVPRLPRTELPFLNPRLQNGELISTPAGPHRFLKTAIR